MDNHPIPQDVTGFKFKLIGSMTVKQFAYVAAGVVGSVILYYLPLQGAWAYILKGILIPIFFGSGLMIAFLPIDGRPLDVMAANFLKAIFSPNQYVYHKIGKKFSFLAISTVAKPMAQSGQKNIQVHQVQVVDKTRQLRQFLGAGSAPKIKNELDAKEMAFLNSLMPTQTQNTTITTPQPVQTTTPQPAKQQAVIPQEKDTHKAAPTAPSPIAKEAIQPSKQQPIQVVKPSTLPQQQSASKIPDIHPEPAQKMPEVKTKAPAQSPTPAAAAPVQQSNELEKQIQEIHSQKKQLEDELNKLKSQLEVHKPEPQTPSASVDSAPQHVRSVPKEQTQRLGIIVPDTPNVVVGIVKDPRGNILPNILVEITDKDGNPVRAFKTNPLGQFASATPLPVGSYTIKLEDPKAQHRFDAVKIAASNQIMLPIEIISYDKREELRKDLFN